MTNEDKGIMKQPKTISSSAKKCYADGNYQQQQCHEMQQTYVHLGDNSMLYLPNNLLSSFDSGSSEENSSDDEHSYEQTSIHRSNDQDIHLNLASLKVIQDQNRRLFNSMQQQGSGEKDVRYNNNENGDFSRLSEEMIKKSRVLNVLQGEVAHSTSSQCDIVLSQNATTCHIVILYSHLSDSDEISFCSVAHMDKETHIVPGLKEMVEEHVLFNATTTKYDTSSQLHCKNVQAQEGIISAKSECMQHKHLIEVHILGGFIDEDGVSFELSNSILNELVRLAEDYHFDSRHPTSLCLKTCAVSCMNDNGFGKPKGRGLRISMTIGDVFIPAEINIRDSGIAGPFFELRMSRLFSEQNDHLHVIHRPGHDWIFIHPFKFECPFYVDDFLSSSDSELLFNMSTSPKAEHDSFCDELRSTLIFLKKFSWFDIFGPVCSTGLYFERLQLDNECKNANKWHFVGTFMKN